MKFLIDAQLPLRLSNRLSEASHDSVHTSHLADGNRTTDRKLTEIADREDRVMVTKDHDFRDSHLLRNAPARLLIVATGNISNDDLIAIFDQNLALIIDTLEHASLVEISQTSIAIHED